MNVTGYTYNGEAYCPACARKIEVPTSDGRTFKMNEYPTNTWDSFGFGVGAIFSDSEWDAPGPCCGGCVEQIETTLIHYE